MKIAFLSMGLVWVLGVSGQGDRVLWVSYLDKVARPVLSALAEDRLHDRMPVLLSERIDNAAERRRVTYLEAFGRTLSGIGPWLNGEGGVAEEVALRRQVVGALLETRATMHQDYYNSYVIQPFLLAVLDVTGARYREFSLRMGRIAQRYAELQERLIGVDGSYPVIGRSITYRCGAFHALADVAEWIV